MPGKPINSAAEIFDILGVAPGGHLDPEVFRRGLKMGLFKKGSQKPARDGNCREELEVEQKATIRTLRDVTAMAHELAVDAGERVQHGLNYQTTGFANDGAMRTLEESVRRLEAKLAEVELKMKETARNESVFDDAACHEENREIMSDVTPDASSPCTDGLADECDKVGSKLYVSSKLFQMMSNEALNNELAAEQVATSDIRTETAPAVAEKVCVEREDPSLFALDEGVALADAAEALAAAAKVVAEAFGVQYKPAEPVAYKPTM